MLPTELALADSWAAGGSWVELLVQGPKCRICFCCPEEIHRTWPCHLQLGDLLMQPWGPKCSAQHLQLSSWLPHQTPATSRCPLATREWTLQVYASYKPNRELHQGPFPLLSHSLEAPPRVSRTILAAGVGLAEPLHGRVLPSATASAWVPREPQAWITTPHFADHATPRHPPDLAQTGPRGSLSHTSQERAMLPTGA